MFQTSMGLLLIGLFSAKQKRVMEWLRHSQRQAKKLVNTGLSKVEKPEQISFSPAPRRLTAHPINDNSYRTLVKQWATILRLDPTNYSTHSLRRSKPHFMFRAGVKIEYISELLGHKDTSTTYRYLGITQEEAQAYALKHDIFKKSLHRSTKLIPKSGRTKDTDVFAACQKEISQRLNKIETSIQNLADRFQNLEAENRALIARIKSLLASSSKPNRGKGLASCW